jgi:hypothetical protein
MKKTLQLNHFNTLCFFVVIIFSCFSATNNTFADESMGLELVSCKPNVTLENENTFSIKKDEIVSFVCAVKNNGTEKFSALLLGKEIKEEGAQAEKNSISTSSVELGAAEHQEIKLVFPAFSEEGNYHFTFSLKDTVSGGSIGKELSYLGVLGGVALDGGAKKETDESIEKGTISSETRTHELTQTKSYSMLFWLGGGAFLLLLLGVFMRHQIKDTRRMTGRGTIHWHRK